MGKRKAKSKVINQINISNFKTHAKTNIDLSAGITVIVGDSEAGKSNILHSFNWAFRNRPLGFESFVRTGEKEVSTDIILIKDDTQSVITRIRNKSTVNDYIIKAGDKSVKFTAFGNSPPQEVLDILNLSDVNIQSQFNPYFLVFDSPGKVATYLRSITGLDELDKVTDNITSKIRDVKQKIIQTETELNEVDERLKEISIIDIEKLENNINESERLIQEISGLDTKKKNIANIVQELKKVIEQKIEIDSETIKEISSELQTVKQSYLANISKRNSVINMVRDLLDVREKAINISNLQQFDCISDLKVQYNNKREKRTLVCNLVESIKMNKKESKADSILILEKEITELKKNLQYCPNCGSKLTEQTKQKLLKVERK